MPVTWQWYRSLPYSVLRVCTISQIFDHIPQAIQVPSSLPQGETEATPVLSALEILEQEENNIDADEDSENEEL